MILTPEQNRAGLALIAERLRRKVEAICDDRRGLHWGETIQDEEVLAELRKHVEREFLAVLDGTANDFDFPYEVSR